MTSNWSSKAGSDYVSRGRNLEAVANQRRLRRKKKRKLISESFPVPGKNSLKRKKLALGSTTLSPLLTSSAATTTTTTSEPIYQTSLLSNRTKEEARCKEPVAFTLSFGT